MKSTAQTIAHLERAFGIGSERDIAWALIDFLNKHNDTSHINLQLVRQLMGDGVSNVLDNAILRTLQFLAGDAIGLLDTKFEILDEEGNPHGIDNDVVKDAINLRINPLTGEVDLFVAEKIFMFFSPSFHPTELQVSPRG